METLIYQKYLLSEGNETNRVSLLLEELFEKANLSNIYYRFLSDKIEGGIENLPEKYNPHLLA